MDFLTVLNAIPYLQGTDLSASIDRFHQHFKDRTVRHAANLIKTLGGWKKPFFLCFDSLPMPKLPGSNFIYESYTFILQSTGGLCFQICYFEVAISFQAHCVLRMLNYILKQLRNCDLIHLLIGIVCDNGTLNTHAIHNKENLPVLWDFRHFQNSIALNQGEHIVMNDVYNKMYFKDTADSEIQKFLKINSEINNKIVQPLVEREINLIHKIILKYFALEPLAAFQLSYCKNDRLEEMGRRWKIGLQRALESIDSFQLVGEPETWFANILIILSLNEARRFNF